MLEIGIFEDLQRKIDEDSAVKDVSRRAVLEFRSPHNANEPLGASRHCPKPREARPHNPIYFIQSTLDCLF